ncbi:MAG: hypothetical protein ACU84Q_17080 [Gammaproteobacteria bacterium]
MLEALGNIGDFIGGIAVVITLIYLARQIRHNSNTVEAATVQAASQAFAEMLDTFVKDPELMNLYLSGCKNFDELSAEERLRYSGIMGMLLHRFEGFVSLQDRGLLPPDSWDGAVNRLKGAFALPGTLSWWQKGGYAFNSKLQQWVNDEIIGKPTNAPSA